MKIALLTGGTGLEKEIAIKSANTFHVNMLQEHDFYVLPDDLDAFIVNHKKYDLAVPVFHGEYGEDGKIFGLLDSLNIKHCFSPFKTHVICMDKFMTNTQVEKIGIITPKSYLIEKISEIKDIDIGYPVIVKPNSGGSSFSTYKVNCFYELKTSVENVFEISGDLALVQEFIEGTEYSVPVIGNKDLEILPIMKVDLKSGDFFDYEEKYNSDGKNEVFGEIDDILKMDLEEVSKKIYKFLGCSGIARIDFIVNPNGIYFLEVNTIPGFTEASIFPKAWILTGRTIKEIVDKIIQLGLE